MRWQPTRAGLLNVWRYDDEVLTFHNGRLLLRGANGSGKSMALELLFPFLFDASVLPGRLSSAQKSRGGLYDRLMTGADGTGRIGFLWAEFRAGEETFTIGVRLRASTSTRNVERDWFTTSLVVGESLQLLDEDRSPLLSRKALVHALGDCGTVYESAEEYRASVRAHLFAGFDVRQYDAVITTLLALRQEKVSQDLTPDKLSEILTASLPPVDEYRITEVAEGFERLDRRKASIEQLEADLSVIKRLQRQNRTYARTILTAMAGRVRSTQNERDAVTRDERTTGAQLEQEGAEEHRVEDDLAAAEQTMATLAAEVDSLKNLDAYKAGGQLVPLREEARRARGRAGAEDAAAAETNDELRRAEDEVADASHRLGAASSAERTARDDVTRLGDDADAAAIVDEVAGLEPDAADAMVCAWLTTKRAASREVREALSRLKAAIVERRHREEAAEEERSLRADAVTAAAAAEAAMVDAVATFRGEIATWASGCRALDLEAVRHSLLHHERGADPRAALALVARVAAPALEALAVRRAQAEVDLADNHADAANLGEERAALAAGRAPEPEAALWRTPGAREGRAGAPLWRLLDFHADVTTVEREGVESALSAVGLLDAWVDASGALVLPEPVADAFAAPFLPSPTQRSLASVIVASGAEDGEVPVEVVEAILASVVLVDSVIGVEPGEGRPAVGLDGTFRFGPLAGRGPDARARFIGTAAQERARRDRMAEIDDELAALARAAAEIGHGIEVLDRERCAIDAEVASFPAGDAVEDARLAHEIARQRAHDAAGRVERAVQQLRQAEEAARQAQLALTRLAAAHRLPTDPDALDEYDERLVRLDRAVAAWTNRRRDAARAVAALTAAERARDRAVASAQNAARRREDAEREAADLEARLRALDETVGASFREVQDRIDAALVERQRQETAAKSLRIRRVELAKAVATLEAKAAEIEGRRVDVEARREEAHRQFSAGVSDGLAADADIPLPHEELAGVGDVVDASRAVLASAGDAAPDDPALSRAEGQLHETLHVARQSLLGRIEVTLDQSDGGWWTLRTTSGGLRRSVAATVMALQGDLLAAQEEFRDDEHRLFDETLSGNVRVAVAERLRRARQLVDGVNDELVEVRTEASGVGVRLKWEVDPEQSAAVRSARNLLLRDAADWTEDERQGMYAFFRARLADARARLDGTAGWEDRLREALDYRRWHRFVLELRHQDSDGYQAATAQRLARLSTGERSIALHLPMLAAVAAHYDGGGTPSDLPGCPRLILLDELFAGVDVVNRRQLFGMFVAWDLDAIFTSDHEWCAYDSLDGIAIHHLHPAEPGEPVTTSRFVWDGRERRTAPLELVST
ncbi:MAG: TIGR02680 family protein [Actinobacteria bacterium]|nr:TIGR02680 family protein [Actinomycetota bacterium]